MAYSEEALRYNNVTDILLNTFGDVLHRDTVYSIVESCCGDLNHAANAIMSITSEENNRPPPIENPSYYGPTTKQQGYATPKKSRGKSRSSTNSYPPLVNETNNKFSTPSPNFSYAKASSSKSNNAVSNQPNNSISGFPKLSNNTLWTDQIKRIVTYHNQGTRTLIIMRGAPGSGKTYLAHQILEITVGTAPQNVHIFSTDDYFMIDGHYKYDRRNLHHAHTWNQYRVFEALNKGVSPVIIDNTNVEYWEIQPYAKAGVSNGYLLEVVEPNTKWAKNLYQLSTRNKHGVTLNTIKRMLENLETSITSASLITNLNLVYPPDKEPPVLRNLPKIVSDCNQIFSPYTIKEIESSLQAELEMQDAIFEVEDYGYSLLTDINSGTQAETTPVKTPSRPYENIKYAVEQEGECIEVKLDRENLEFKCDKGIADDQGGITYEDKEKDSLNDKVETLTMEEDQNIVLEAKLLEQSDKKDEIFSRKNDKVKEYDCVAAQSISQQSAPSKYIEAEATLIETSNSTEIKGLQLQFEKMLEEFQKVENEWENGEAWEEDVNTNNTKPITANLKTSTDSKSPRKRKTKENKNSLKNLDDDNDWRKIYPPMSSFTDNNNISSILSKNAVENKSAETCMEVGDTDTSIVKNGFKVLFAVARDININYVLNLLEKIPEKRKLDKSSMTNEVSVMAGTHRCRNEDKHFRRFRNMFKHLKKDDLRHVFDNCCGDVNWAVTIVMDDTANSHFERISVDEQSEVEEDIDEPCDCTSSYGIIPDVTPSDLKEQYIFSVPCTSAISTETKNVIKKQKKDSPISDSSLALKRQLEQNIVISDQHYSEHCLRVRKMRRGILDGEDSTSQNIKTGITIHNPNQLDTFSMLSVDSNTDAENQDVGGPSTFEALESEYNSDEEIPFKEVEKTININLGTEFLSQLDALFGRADMKYSGNIEPKINMPISMLNQINDLWMESLMCQLEAESKAHEEMIKQDEEFARALALEQLELSKSGREPEVPNFKEIMDMEFALSLYRKDCEETMQKERPNDMAAKLSVKKLYDLFPEIPQGDLDEILMAHNYDFRTTVGVLLETQGRTDVTQEENGVNKFIMAKELERQEKYLAAEKKRLMEQEMIEIPQEVSMNTVNTYRSKAQSHLANWNKNFGKAKQLMKKNAAVANYYNNLAGLHLLKYELANNVAAVTLLHINAKNNGSCVNLDLHYLHVEEAKAALDIFLDSHIQRCRMSKSGEKYPELLIITGRGLHSRGGPKIKPATEIQLNKRQLPFKELNPGMLSVQISPRTKLSYQIP